MSICSSSINAQRTDCCIIVERKLKLKLKLKGPVLVRQRLSVCAFLLLLAAQHDLVNLLQKPCV